MTPASVPKTRCGPPFCDYQAQSSAMSRFLVSYPPDRFPSSYCPPKTGLSHSQFFLKVDQAQQPLMTLGIEFVEYLVGITSLLK